MPAPRRPSHTNRHVGPRLPTQISSPKTAFPKQLPLPSHPRHQSRPRRAQLQRIEDIGKAVKGRAVDVVLYLDRLDSYKLGVLDKRVRAALCCAVLCCAVLRFLVAYGGAGRQGSALLPGLCWAAVLAGGARSQVRRAAAGRPRPLHHPAPACRIYRLPCPHFTLLSLRSYHTLQAHPPSAPARRRCWRA